MGRPPSGKPPGRPPKKPASKSTKFAISLPPIAMKALTNIMRYEGDPGRSAAILRLILREAKRLKL